MPKSVEKILFYPILEGSKVTIDQLRTEFPATWKYLESHKKELQKGDSEYPNWWVPHRLRDPNILFRAKIVTPHLVLLPKFALDALGKFAVSHSPFLTARDNSAEKDFLTYFLGILNSNVGAWLISTHSDKYSRGYARLEVGTLKKIPVPNPAKISSSYLANMIFLVNEQTKKTVDIEIEKEIDQLAAKIYDISASDLNEIGLLGGYASNHIK